MSLGEQFGIGLLAFLGSAAIIFGVSLFVHRQYNLYRKAYSVLHEDEIIELKKNQEAEENERAAKLLNKYGVNNTDAVQKQ